MKTCPTCRQCGRCPQVPAAEATAPKNFPYQTKPTIVVFRRWREGGEVVALFPYLPEVGGRCQSFMHVGQHAAADYALTIEATEPASAGESADVRALAAELIRAPYFYHLKPLRAEELVVEPGATAPLTGWQMCQFIAANSVDESTAESVWASHNPQQLVEAYTRLRRDPAAA